jgi:hypothetical protein
MGYHLKEIERGVFGEFSKIVEEFQELQDAQEQDNKIMQLIEMSDLIGAIEGYANKEFGFSLDSLTQMKDATHKAFNDGTRQAKSGFTIDWTKFKE